MARKTQPAVTIEARQQREQRWRASFENSGIGMMMADYNGRFLVANRVFRNMLGYSQSELGRTNLMKALQRADGRIYGRGGATELLEINPTTLALRSERQDRTDRAGEVAVTSGCMLRFAGRAVDLLLVTSYEGWR